MNYTQHVSTGINNIKSTERDRYITKEQYEAGMRNMREQYEADMREMRELCNQVASAVRTIEQLADMLKSHTSAE